MPLYYRDYTSSGYPPIDSKDLSASFQQYESLTLTERMRFRLLHGGRPFGQTIPQKKILKMDPKLVVAENIIQSVRLPHPPSCTSLKPPQRAPFSYRRATRYQVIDGIREGVLLAANGSASEEEVVSDGPSAFGIYQKELVDPTIRSSSYTESLHSLIRLNSPRSPSALEVTQEFLASMSGQGTYSRHNMPWCSRSIPRSSSSLTKRSDGVRESWDGSPLGMEVDDVERNLVHGPRLFLPEGCDPLSPIQCALPLLSGRCANPSTAR